MKKLILILSILLLPGISYASIAVGWNATSTNIGGISPNRVNGNDPFIKAKYFIATSTTDASTLPKIIVGTDTPDQDISSYGLGGLGIYSVNGDMVLDTNGNTSLVTTGITDITSNGAVGMQSTAAGFNIFGQTMGWLNAGSLRFTAPFGAYFDSGKVGIGTTTPGTDLGIGNTGSNTINISATATSTFGSGINLRTGCFAVSGACVGGSSLSGGTTQALTYWSSPTTIAAAVDGVGTTTIGNGGLIVNGGGFSVQTWPSNGTRVGVGAMVARTKLHFQDTGGAGGYPTIAANDLFMMEAGDDEYQVFLNPAGKQAGFLWDTPALRAQGYYFYNTGSNTHEWGSNNGSAVMDLVGGKLGIGTGGPLSKLDVNGGVAIGTYAGANAAPSNGLIASGNVGIGTTTPWRTLSVTGTVGLDGLSSGTGSATCLSSNKELVTCSGVSVPLTNATSTAVLDGQTASITSVNTYTPTASSTYMVIVTTDVTAEAVQTLTVSVTYTDAGGTSRTQNFFGMGLTTAAIGSTGDSNFPPMTIRPLKNTAITVSTTVAGIGSINYKIDASIIPVSTQ